MKPVKFPEANVIIAENQDEYESLPAFVRENGKITYCFKLDDSEIEEIKNTGNFWVTLLTFGQPVQPILLSTKKSDHIPDNILVFPIKKNR